jgi:FtsH-binding integral membrane protein
VIGLLAGRSVPVGVRGDAALALLTNVGYDEGVLKALTEMRKRREAAWVLAGGVAVAAAPAFWYSQVWPDAGRYGQDTNPTRSAWWFVFACSIGPFILVAALREAGSMSRVATYTAAVVVAVSVVLGQLAGLDPHDPSSTGSIAVVTTAVGAAMLVVIIFVVDEQIRAAVSRRRQAEENP